jgi:hypothetical protein
MNEGRFPSDQTAVLVPVSDAGGSVSAGDLLSKAQVPAADNR